MTLENFIITFVALCLIVAVRYFIFAGAFYWALWKRDPEKVKARKLTNIRPPRSLIVREIRWSLISSVIYAFPGAIMLEAWKTGGTALYTNVSDHGWPYLFFSVLLYLFIHDTYFYWTHRMMHHPKLFRVMHRAV